MLRAVWDNAVDNKSEQENNRFEKSRKLKHCCVRGRPINSNGDQSKHPKLLFLDYSFTEYCSNMEVLILYVSVIC